jgi:hypothetical protein
MNARMLAVVVAVAAGAPVHAQVFKCVDAQGRTTYQQAPCGKDEKGSRVELVPDNGMAGDAPQLEAQWATAAKQGQVQPGMPRRFVQAAYGVPTETRAGSPAERASEVWIYRNPGGTRLVGFLDGRVAWERGDDASAEPPMRDEAGDTAVRRGDIASARLSITPGQDCEAALAIAGSPERSEAVLLPTPGARGTTAQTAGMRHVFASDGGTPPQRMAIVCVNGLVSDVERPAR